MNAESGKKVLYICEAMTTFSRDKAEAGKYPGFYDRFDALRQMKEVHSCLLACLNESIFRPLSAFIKNP